MIKSYHKLKKAFGDYLVAAQINTMESPEEASYLDHQEVIEANIICNEFQRRRVE